MSGILIHVTTKHINDSKRKSSSHCMIAEAIKEQIVGAKFVSVDVQTIRYSETSKNIRIFYLTPRKAQQGIIAFDQGSSNLRPFNFVLRAPHYTPINANAARKALAQGLEMKPARNDQLQLIKTSSHGGGATLIGTADKRAWPISKIGRRREFGLRAINR